MVSRRPRLVEGNWAKQKNHVSSTLAGSLSHLPRLQGGELGIHRLCHRRHLSTVRSAHIDRVVFTLPTKVRELSLHGSLSKSHCHSLPEQ